MFEEPELKLSWSPKAHHIADHLSDYFDDGGEALGVTTDQVIEHMHSCQQNAYKIHVQIKKMSTQKLEVNVSTRELSK